MIDVRIGREEEIEQAIELGRLYHMESPYRDIPFDAERGRALCKTVLDHGLALVAVDGDKMVGMMGAVITNYFFSEEPVSQDILIYVHPDYRSQGIAGRFIGSYVQWALERGVKPWNIFLGIISGIHNQSTESLYRSLGFETCGVVMRYSPDITQEA